MIRNNTIRLAAHAKPNRRAFATTVPPPHPSETPKGGFNVPLIIGGLLLAGGGYWYYTRPEDVQKVEKETKEKYNEYKGEAKEKIDAAKQRASAEYSKAKGTAQDVTSRAENRGATDRSTYDPLKRDTSPNEIDEYSSKARGIVREGVDSAKAKVEEGKKEASGWFGWGKSKGEDVKQDAAKKVEKGAEDVRKEAAKRA